MTRIIAGVAGGRTLRTPPGSGTRPTSDRVREAVAAHCEERLARFKRPGTIQVVTELPYTVTGKVQKGRLRAAERRRTLELLGDPSTP